MGQLLRLSSQLPDNMERVQESSREVVHSEASLIPFWALAFTAGSGAFLAFLIIVIAQAPMQFLVVIFAFELIPLYVAFRYPSKSSLYFQNGKVVVVNEFIGSPPRVNEFSKDQVSKLYLTRCFRSRDTSDDYEIEFAVTCIDLQGRSHSVLPALEYSTAVKLIQRIAAYLDCGQCNGTEPELHDPQMGPILRHCGILTVAVFLTAFLGLWLTS